jgi:CSLREA domain-containing protein
MSPLALARSSTRLLSVFLFGVIVFAVASWLGLPQQASTRRHTADIGNRSTGAFLMDKRGITPEAVTIVVNSTSDVANGADGLCTLREAITAANNNAASGAVAGECAAGGSSGSDAISLTGITGTINLTGPLPDIVSDLTLTGPGSGLLTVRRDTGGDYRIFHTNNRNVDISGMTISNGKTPDGIPTSSQGGSGGSGGGIWQLGGVMNLNDVVVTANRTGDGGAGTTGRGGSGGSGGGISGSGTLTMVNVSVTNNVTGAGAAGSSGGDGGFGGGVEFNGTALSLTNVTITNNTTGNGGNGFSGGASGGSSGGGGGVDATATTLTISRTTISNNSTSTAGNASSAGWGGGVQIRPSTVATIQETVVANNRTGNGGGGFTGQGGFGGGITNSGVATILGCAITGNTTGNAGPADGDTGGKGGGIFNGGSLTMANTTISGNSTTGINAFGGGLYNNASMWITNSTITGNSSSTSSGNGIAVPSFSQASVVRNTIVAGNATTGTILDIGGVCTSQGHNLIGKSDGTNGFTNGVNADQVGTVASPIDPGLASLANNGGATMTHALLTGSAALDAGDNCVTDAAHCGDAHTPQLLTDQRGTSFTRLADGPDADTTAIVDIGAYETQPALANVPDVSTNEDTPVSASFDGGDTSTITSITATSSSVVVPNDSAHLSAALTGSTVIISITPAANESGTANITVTVNRTGGPESKTFMLTVNPVNDVPTFTKGTDQVVNEDAGAQTVNGWATNISSGPPDESSQTVTFQVTNNSNPSLFSGAPAITSVGTLTYTPAAEANGSATISINLKDNGGTANGGVDTSAVQSFTITVNSVNDPPSFTKGPDKTVNEDPGSQNSLWATNISAGPANENGQSLNFTVTNNSNPSLFSSAPVIGPTGFLAFTPALNANGSAVITVVLKDSGGTANGGVDTSAAQTFTITVNPVNDPPSFVKGPNQTVVNNAGAQTVANWATNISPGPADEAGQTVAFQVTTNNQVFFTVLPAISANGTLTYTPNPNNTGAALVSVVLKDNGGTANGGNDTSAAQSFTITSTPSGGSFSFLQSGFPTTESSGSVTVTVRRTGDTTHAASVDYVTGADNGVPCSVANGLATPKCDFTSAIGTLNFAPGDSSKTFSILISQDSFVEGNETFTVTLSNPTGGAGLTAPTIATVTIVDDNTEPPTNAIDDAGNFVRMHYHDFLNREADQSGLNFWTGQMTNCGAADLTVCRVNVSGSFFLSIEFQQTGYLVERIYKAAYGDATGTSTFGGGSHQLGVPVVRFNEFLKDTQRIGQGVVVLQPGWEQALENNKQAYAGEFVATSRFVTAFPTTMTPAQFVDQLNQNAGNVLSVNERTTAINLFGGAADSSNTTARAQALRQVAEDPDLFNAESNRAFVLAQYFGYLRRNPNDLPDTDYTGYEFWLNKLNQFNGDYVAAEMVKAFISAGEYRQRFGP